MIDVEDFKPKKNQLGFYNCNFYQWLKSKRENEVKIFKTPMTYHPLIVGSRDCNGAVTGFKLIELFTNESNKDYPQIFCYGNKNWPDVTKEFYAKYKRIGVCAIGGDARHNWEITDNGNYRICSYCEKVEQKTAKAVKRVTWESAE